MAERIERIEAAVEKIVASIAKLEPWMFVRSESYFNYDESVALPVTIVPGANHIFKEAPLKFMWLAAIGVPIQVSLNRAVSGDSFIVPNGAIIWVPRLTSRVWGTATVGAGILYIWGFW